MNRLYEIRMLHHALFERDLDDTDSNKQFLAQEMQRTALRDISYLLGYIETQETLIKNLKEEIQKLNNFNIKE